MRWSKIFIPTLRDEPAAASAGERLLIRAGYFRSQGALLLGRRSIAKIQAMLRQEMKSLGAQEILLSAPLPESAISIAAHDLRSYKQLPQIWFQFDGASFQCCSFAFELPARSLYEEIFNRCGLKYIALQDEYAVRSADGDQLITQESNLKRARTVAKPPAIPDPPGDLKPEEFHTPGLKTIADICAFTGLPETSQMKSLVMVADGVPVLILLRGDHTLNEHKLRAKDFRQATPAEIRGWFGADPGSLGPVGVANMRIVADEALRGRRNMCCGANRNDYHLRNVTPGEDFQADFLDLRMVVEGDASLIDQAPLRFERAFTLASFDRREADMHVSNEAGKEVALPVGHVEISLERMLIAAAEQHADADGLALAPAIAPFDVIITPVNLKDAAQQSTAHVLYAELAAAGLDPLLDDREERPGVKFKDADLTGIPYRITVGKKLAQGLIEVVDRRTRESQDVAADQAAAFLSQRISK